MIALQHPAKRTASKLLILIMLIATGCGNDEKKKKACNCVVGTGEYREPASISIAAPMHESHLTARLKLTPPPQDRITSPVWIYIDEMHAFSDERRRVIEREIEISYDQPNYRDHLTCGTVNETYRQNQSCCDEGFSMYDPVDQYRQGSIEANGRGDLENIDLITFDLDFDRPDKRSRYFIGIHIDLDQDGKVSDGDYFTKEFVEVFGEAGIYTYLVAEQLRKERVIASGTLDPGDLPALTSDQKAVVTLLDASAPSSPRVIATSQTSDASFAISAIPETDKAVWKLTAWIDRNGDNTVDACDYVEQMPILKYSLDDLQNTSIPMTYAGGSPEECEGTDVPEDRTSSDNGSEEMDTE